MESEARLLLLRAGAREGSKSIGTLGATPSGFVLLIAKDGGLIASH